MGIANAWVHEVVNAFLMEEKPGIEKLMGYRAGSRDGNGCDRTLDYGESEEGEEGEESDEVDFGRRKGWDVVCRSYSGRDIIVKAIDSDSQKPVND